MTICDLTIYQGEHDHDQESELEHECEEWQNKCLQTFTEPKDAENKYNCLMRYGFSHHMMA